MKDKMPGLRPIIFLGDTLERLRAFPRDARHQAGYQLERVQRGLDPDDWKPLSSVGLGVREIRIRDRTGGYRVIYIANYVDGVAVLAAFHKKTRKTPLREVELAAARLGSLRWRRQ